MAKQPKELEKKDEITLVKPLVAPEELPLWTPEGTLAEQIEKQALLNEGKMRRE